MHILANYDQSVQPESVSEGVHVLDNVAKAALELELIIPRATLQPLGLRANTAVPKRLSQGVLKTPVGNGDDHDPAPCDGAAPLAGGAL
jgi:hypothetical protein